MSEAGSLSERGRRLMQVAYDRFRLRGTWSALEAIQRELDRASEDLDVHAAVTEIPRLYLRGRPDINDELRLSLCGVQACTGSAEDVANFLAAVRLAVERRLGPEETPEIMSADFEQDGEDPVVARRLLSLLDGEAYIVAGGRSTDREWSRNVSPRVRRFRGISTIEEYFKVREALDAELRREATHTAAPLPGSPRIPVITSAEVVAAMEEREPSVEAPLDSVMFNTTALTARYAELEQRAGTALPRLESGPLSAALPSLYSIFAEAGDDENAQRVLLESQGFPFAVKLRAETSDAEVRGMDRYMRGRRTPGLKSDDKGGFAVHPMIELERILELAATESAVEFIEIAREVQILIERIRMDLVVAVTKLRQRLREDAQAILLFGADALSVLEAGGEILAPLRRAAGILRPGYGPGAALEARSALIAIGEKLLPPGPKERVSPIDGSKHSVEGERNRVHVVLDHLWSQTTDPPRRDLLNRAHAAAERAYVLGSSAKRPGGVSYEDCVECLRLTFEVARAVTLCAGFPLRSSTTSGEPTSS